MVNGYANYPSELLFIDNLSNRQTIEGIHDKLNKLYNLNKPFVGTFTYRGITATFMPTVFKADNDIYTSFIMANVSVSIIVYPDDTLTIQVGA